MKRVLILGLCLCCLSIPVLADEVTPESPVTVSTDTVTTDSGDTININVSVPTPSAASAESEEPAVDDSLSLSPDAPSVVYSAAQVDAPSADESGVESTLSSVVEVLFGTYTPKTQTVTDYLSDGSTVTHTEIVPGVAGMDWHWIAGVGLFALSLWSLFCLIGGVLKHG